MPPCRSRPSFRPAGAMYFFHQSGSPGLREGSRARAQKTRSRKTRPILSFKLEFMDEFLCLREDCGRGDC